MPPCMLPAACRCMCASAAMVSCSRPPRGAAGKTRKGETICKSRKMENGTESKGHAVLQSLSLALTLNSADSCTENLLRSYRISRSMERLRNAGGNERSGGVCNLGVSGV